MLVCSCLLPGLAARATIADFTAIADTSLIASSPDNNTGGNDFLSAGNGGGSPRRALIQFDLASLPAGAIVNAATLTLTVPSGNTGNPSSFDLFRVLGSWGEGTNTGSSGTAAEPGDATWNSRFQGSLLWNTPGGDYATTTSATTFVSGLGVYTWSSTRLAADVQLWAGNSSTNFGWILISQAEDVSSSARRFGSREDPPNAPVLAIDYTTIPEPSTALLTAIALLSAASVRVRVRSERDRRVCAGQASPGCGPDGFRPSSR
jgi:hypothetical protein